MGNPVLRKAYAVMMVGLVLTMSSCTSVTTTTTSGTAEPVGRGAPVDAIPVYLPDPSGGGWPTQPIDQPRPLPGRSWNWLADKAHGMCQFLDSAFLKRLGWNGSPLAVEIACTIPIGGDAVVQVLPAGTYENFSAFDADKIAFMRPISIEGLEAREYDSKKEQDKYPGSCEVMVDTRSLTSLIVLAGTPQAPGRTVDPAPQCARARQAATMLVDAFVPLVGGTPWSKTPQTLSKKDVLRHNACDLLGYDDLVVGGIDTNDKGTLAGDGASCTYHQDQQTITVRTHQDQGLDVALQHAEPSNGPVERTTLGKFPATVKLAASGSTCTEAVQATQDLALSVSYTNARLKPAEVCKAAEGILGGEMATLMDAIP